jgi:hypothetical protein
LQNNFELLQAEQKISEDISNIVPFNYSKQRKAM